MATMSKLLGLRNSAPDPVDDVASARRKTADQLVISLKIFIGNKVVGMPFSAKIYSMLIEEPLEMESKNPFCSGRNAPHVQS